MRVNLRQRSPLTPPAARAGHDRLGYLDGTW